MTVCLYLTETKPSRKGVQQLVAWLSANHPDCSFTEINGVKTSVSVNRGRYLGRIDAPPEWAEAPRPEDRQAIRDAARQLLAG